MPMLDDAPPWLRELAGAADDYVRSLFDTGLKIEAAPEAGDLPFYLRDQFEFLNAQILRTPLLLMVQRPTPAPTPANIARLWREAHKRASRPVVYLAPAISAFNRKRLLEQGTPFLVPGNQLFLPDLGVDLRETFRSHRQSAPTDRLSPASQVLVLAMLYKLEIQGRTAAALAQQFDYSAMTLGRAFDELAAFGLASVREEGRERRLEFKTRGRALWRRAANVLKSPVRKRRMMRRGKTSFIGPMAGESALAHYTMLEHPRHPTIAVAASKWLKLEDRFAGEANRWDDERIDVETWSYDPHTLTKSDVVDRLSLHLSCRGHADERVSQAAEHLLEEMEW